MESQREGADPLSPKPRYKVLRAGIRYVGEQFPPYDETPWDEPLVRDIVGIDPATGKPLFLDPNTGKIISEIGEEFSRAMISSARQFGKAIAEIGNALKVQGVTVQSLWKDEASDPLTDLEKAARKMSEPPSAKEMAELLRLPEQFRNDGNTFKLPKQNDPYYVKLTQRKRR